MSWSETIGNGAQIIVIDNRPPDVAESHVVVRCSGRAEEPPCGRIGDEAD